MLVGNMVSHLFVSQVTAENLGEWVGGSWNSRRNILAEGCHFWRRWNLPWHWPEWSNWRESARVRISLKCSYEITYVLIVATGQVFRDRDPRIKSFGQGGESLGWYFLVSFFNKNRGIRRRGIGNLSTESIRGIACWHQRRQTACRAAARGAAKLKYPC